MQRNDLYHQLLSASNAAYMRHEELRNFADFPTNLKQQAMVPIDRPASRLLQEDKDLKSAAFADLQSAIIAAAPVMRWRAIYDSKTHDTRFMDKLGCYSIIGKGGPFASNCLRLFIVYMPAGLYYPWHIHPAEEMYMVISGSAIFKRGGTADENLSEGQSMFHESNQPHAIETTDTPMLSLVAWRNHLETPPSLINPDEM